ncbi:MAG: HAD-IA family hydrolase [Candidatus Devosia phytovorans]|uniref:HAD-IA family hydrolase n=1 Tax=Candidatus Devosia phytovorans TaxID=3121372 RepID=A0AAJ5VWY0_9HYPH|nr:HAD-IA family hydrolase [Devosia sp.]WEK05596.1 MAG: HAD-IA family hydrolase [Devosia sp.]
MTRAVLFDVDGVIIHGYHANPARVRPWDANLLADMGVDPDRFRREFIFDLFMKKVITGEMALIPALERRLPALGYKGSPMVFAHYWLTHDSELNAPLLDVIRQLKAREGLKLYLATNQEHLRAQHLWSHLGLSDLFEDIFYAARIGARKPDPRFFTFVDDKLGPQSEPPLFFDDSPEVIAGARKHGWEAVLFNTVDDCTSHPWIAERLIEAGK